LKQFLSKLQKYSRASAWKLIQETFHAHMRFLTTSSTATKRHFSVFLIATAIFLHSSYNRQKKVCKFSLCSFFYRYDSIKQSALRFFIVQHCVINLKFSSEGAPHSYSLKYENIRKEWIKMSNTIISSDDNGSPMCD